MQLCWGICLIDLFTHLNRILQITFKFSFTSNMVKQKDPEWNVFDIIKPKIIFREKMTLIGRL